MSMEIGKEILNQLGGNRFAVMTGSKNFVYDSNKQTLRMKLTRNTSKANYLSICLEANDTYTMTFSRLHAGNLRTVEVLSEVYCDMLQDCFTSVTGLYTRF